MNPPISEPKSQSAPSPNWCCDASGGSACRQASRFEHDDALVAEPVGIEQRDRQHGGLSRARRGDEDGSTAVSERGFDVGDCFEDWKVRERAPLLFRHEGGEVVAEPLERPTGQPRAGEPRNGTGSPEAGSSIDDHLVMSAIASQTFSQDLGSQPSAFAPTAPSTWVSTKAGSSVRPIAFGLAGLAHGNIQFSSDSGLLSEVSINVENYRRMSRFRFHEPMEDELQMP